VLAFAVRGLPDLLVAAWVLAGARGTVGPSSRPW
jgi:hypothetical protein